MNDDALGQLADSYGIARGYWDQSGQHHQVSDDTLRAVLAALDVATDTPGQVADALRAKELHDWRRVLPPVFVHRQSRTGRIWVHVPNGTGLRAHIVLEDGSSARPAQQVEHWVAPRDVDGALVGEAAFEIPAGLPLGWHEFQARIDGVPEPVACPLVVTPDRLPPVPRGWGLMTQLYSVRSQQSWGLGDLGDLRDLAVASAKRFGADFVLVNPLHAAGPVAPLEPSPYLPATRRFVSPLYLRIKDIPEYQELTAAEQAEIQELAAPARATHDGDGLLDRDLVWDAKRTALERIWSVARAESREEQFQAFCQREGLGLQDFALWCALVERHGPRWQDWPEPLRDPRSPAVTLAFAELEERVGFHSWLQWLLDHQLRDSQQSATDAGMRVGILHDLAVGVHGEGADSWRLQSVLASDVTVGAPPDVYNQRGQDWSQPPWRPDALADAAFLPYRDMLRTILRHSGGIRVDHILGLYRQWWIPEGQAPTEGTYVRMDHEALIGILVLEAARVGAVVIGEDLGTVEDWIRDDMLSRGILGTGVLWFERGGHGITPPEQWREQSFASVTVHDLPPTPGYLAGTHVQLRADLDLLTQDVDSAWAEHRREIDDWIAFCRDRGWCGDAPDTAELVLALHRCLAASPATMVGVSLPDLTGDVRSQNQPGTNREYPNWCVPLSDGTGRPVPLAEVLESPTLAEVAAIVRR